ncbi:MAG: hypothetical protein M3285_02065 [Actinomycetota bacterium]|nr:hypothetical protein [Actinomycetota bacterium]
MARSPRSRSGRGLRHALLVLLLLPACTSGITPEHTPPPVADPLLERAERDGTVVVIAQLAVPRGNASSYDATRIRNAQRRLMSELGPGARVVERFGRSLPQIMLRVTPEALQELRRSSLVVNISLNETDEPTE